MILSPTSAIEKTLRIALDEAKGTIDDMTGVWSQTAKRSWAVIKRASHGNYGFEKYTDSYGSTHHALIGVENSFGYADVKMMTCAIGDLFNASMIAPLKVIDRIDRAMDRLEKLIERYIARWTKDVVSYVKETLKDLMFWKKFYCWGDSLIKWLSELNDKYGSRTIEEWSPFLTDFCILAKECPLLKEYVLDTPYMKNLATKLNRASDRFDNWVAQTTADSVTSVSDFFQKDGRGGATVSDWISSTVEFYKNAKEGNDPASQGIENMQYRAEIRSLEAEISSETDPAKKATLQKSLDAKKLEYSESRDRSRKIRENVRKYVSSVLTLDEIRKRAENTSLGFTPDQLSNGVPIGLDGKAQVEFDENGRAVSISYVSNSGEVCQKSPFDMNTYEPSDDMSKILDRLCNFTLADLFQNVLDMINSVMTTISSVLDTTVDVLARWIKKGISFVKTMIVTPFLSAMQKSMPFSDTIMKVMNFYKDWLKCQSLFCPSPYTDKMVKLGRKLVRQFRSHVRYEMVPRVDSEGKPILDTNGNPVMRKVYYYAVDEILSTKLIDPFVNGILGIVDATAFAVKTVAKGCDADSNGDGETDLVKKTLKQWDSYIKPAVDSIDDLVYTVIDATDIVRCLRSQNPDVEYRSRAGMVGTWMDDNLEELKAEFAKTEYPTDLQARRRIIDMWHAEATAIRGGISKDTSKNYMDNNLDDPFLSTGSPDDSNFRILADGLKAIIPDKKGSSYIEAMDMLAPQGSDFNTIYTNVKNFRNILGHLNLPPSADAVFNSLAENYKNKMIGFESDTKSDYFISGGNKIATSEVYTSISDYGISLLTEFASTILPKTLDNISKSLSLKMNVVALSQGYLGNETVNDRLTEDAGKLVQKYLGLGDSFRRKLARGMIFADGKWVTLISFMEPKIDRDIIHSGNEKLVDEYMSLLFVDVESLMDSFLQFARFEMNKATISFSTEGLNSNLFSSGLSNLEGEELKRWEEILYQEALNSKEAEQQYQRDKAIDDLNASRLRGFVPNIDKSVKANSHTDLDNFDIASNIAAGIIANGDILMDTKTNSRTTDKNLQRKMSALSMNLDLKGIVVPDRQDNENMKPIEELKRIIR